MTAMKRRSKNLIAAAVVLTLATAAVVLFSVRRASDDAPCYLWIEAESAASVQAPMEIVDDPTASDGRCVVLREGMGAAIVGHRSGEARFEVAFPRAGRYVLWARTYWTNGCGNSFYVSIGDMLFHFGEDSLFEEWHWINMLLPEVSGPCTRPLTIRNREDGVKIDELLITTDASFVPQGLGGEVRIYRFDDGRTAGWRPLDAARGEVRDGCGMDGSPAYCLTAERPEDGCRAITEYRRGGEFRFRCLARCGQSGPAGKSIVVLFAYRDDDRCWSAEFADGSVLVERRGDGVERVVASSPDAAASLLRLDEAYHLYEVAHEEGRLTVSFDGAVAVECPAHSLGGAFGIGSRAGSVCFDDVVIGREHDIRYAENFYFDDERPVEEVRNWEPESGTWTRSSVYGPHSYDAETRTVAVSLAGNTLWHDYRFEAVARGDGESGIGLIFYCTDSRNTYLFRWGGASSTKEYAGRAQLVRVLRGTVTVLAEADGGYEAGEWYRLAASVRSGRIRAFINDRAVFDVTDRGLLQGMIGLYVDGPKGPSAGGRDLELWPAAYTGAQWRQSFPLTVAEERVVQTVYVCYRDSLNHYALRWGGGRDRNSRAPVRLVEVAGGKERILDERPNRMINGHPYMIVTWSLDNRVSISIGETRLDEGTADLRTEEIMRFSIDDPVRGGGKLAFDPGRTVNGSFDDVRVSSDVGVHDDFSAAPGGRPLDWTSGAGSWIVKDRCLRPRTEEPSSIFTGSLGWTDYTLEASFGPDLGERGEAGLFFRRRDDSTHCVLLMRSTGDGIACSVVRRLNGEATVLGGRTLRLRGEERHSVRIELDAGWIDVSFDGAPALLVYDATAGRGGIGLFAAGAPDLRFEEVSVAFDEPHRRIETVHSVFAGEGGSPPGAAVIDGWCDDRGEFGVRGGALRVDGSSRRAVIRRAERRYRDDLSVSFDAVVETGEQTVCGVWLAAVDSVPPAGYLLLVGPGGMELRRNGTVVAAAAGAAMRRGERRAVTLEKRGSMLVGLVDGGCAVSYADSSVLETSSLALVAEGGVVSFDNIAAYLYPRRYYDFNFARFCADDLSHWRTDSGRWGVISSLSYSLFGEKDADGDALLWHRESVAQPFALSLEYSPFATGGGEFFIAFCADGTNARSGYLLGISYEHGIETGAAGTQRVAARLVKRGTTVREVSTTVPRAGDFVRLRLERRGDTIRLMIADRDVLTYRDAAAPPGDRLALGISGPPSRPTFFRAVAVFDLGR